MVPDLLLGAFLVAFALMIVTVFCGIVVTRVLVSSLYVVKKKSPSLYCEILGDRNQSWVERQTGSLRDAPIVWNLACRLYRGDQMAPIVGERTCKKFARCVVATITTFTVAVLIAAVVLVIGFAVVVSQ